MMNLQFEHLQLPYLDRLTPRGRLLALIVAAALAAGLGRDGLVAAALDVRDFLQLPSDQIEIAYGAFSFGFFLALAFGGFIVDAVGTRKSLLVLSMAGAGATILTAFAVNLAMLALFRLILGVTAGALVPVAVGVFAAWMPPQERGSAMGWVLAAPMAGAIVAPPVIWVADHLGSWRLAFIIFALGGGVWLIAFQRYFVARPGLPQDSAAQAAVPEPEKPAVNWPGALRGLALPMALSFIQVWGLALFTDWVPAYLLTFRHFDVRLSWIVTATINLATIAGLLAGGYGADRILQASGNIKVARQIVPGLGFLLALIALIYVPIGGDEIRPVAIWLGIGIFAISAAIVPLWVMPIDVALDHPAIGAALIGFAVMLGHLVSPMSLVHATTLWQPVTWLGGAMLLAAMVGAFLLRPDVELPGPPPKPVAEEPVAPVAPTKKGGKH